MNVYLYRYEESVSRVLPGVLARSASILREWALVYDYQPLTWGRFCQSILRHFLPVFCPKIFVIGISQ
jgi:hypothetical protein